MHYYNTKRSRQSEYPLQVQNRLILSKILSGRQTLQRIFFFINQSIKYKNMERRNRLDLMSKAELAIYHAMQEIEKLPASENLTDAVVLLSQAKDKVADFVDNVE